MQRRSFLRVASGGFIAAAVATPLTLSGCSSELPPEALQAWQGPGEEPDVRRWILAHAILAPHSHNLQSWLVDLRTPDEITLYLDRGPGRLLPETDPWHRQMMLSQGTFLELLDLAARQRGLRADVILFPQGEFETRTVDSRPTAHIRLVADSTVKPDPLFAQVFRRRTNREAYEVREPAPNALQAIAAAVHDPLLRAGFVGGAEPQRLQEHRDIAMEAWRIELQTPRTILESYRVLRVGPQEIAAHRDGLSLNTPLMRALVTLGLFDRGHPPEPGDLGIASQIEDFNAKVGTTPAFFWLVSEGQGRTVQIKAGRAYLRAQLAATAQGLSMHPVSQALQEYPEQAEPYARIHRLLDAPPTRQTVQMWTRLGYAPAIPPSPRRGLDAHILRV
ncbi:Acg family FMN-binding oxidoreductase [Hylemonella sp. W303a]|uniref:Acg family FMN-binding oxidoreductase n=1 Tax=Hylemonella sp. W303a TaxID=3389873 RepID=UPI00396B16A0